MLGGGAEHRENERGAGEQRCQNYESQSARALLQCFDFCCLMAQTLLQRDFLHALKHVMRASAEVLRCNSLKFILQTMLGTWRGWWQELCSACVHTHSCTDCAARARWRGTYLHEGDPGISTRGFQRFQHAYCHLLIFFYSIEKKMYHEVIPFFFFFGEMVACKFLKQNHPYFKVTPSPLSSDHLLHYLKHLLTVHISLATILEAVASSQRKRQDVFSTVRSWLPSLEYLISPRRRLPARLCSLLCERPACTTQHILASWQGHYITNGQ